MYFLKSTCKSIYFHIFDRTESGTEYEIQYKIIRKRIYCMIY